MADNLDSQRVFFRHSLWSYYSVESGTFSLYGISPFGKRGRLLDRVAEIIGEPLPSTQADLEKMAAVYIDFCLNFPELVSSVSLKPGTYPVVDVTGTVDSLMAEVDPSAAEAPPEVTARWFEAMDTSFAASAREFTVTETHLVMARKARINVEFGMQPVGHDDGAIRAALLPLLLEIDTKRSEPAFRDAVFEYPIVTGDGKRPFGDRTYYYWDMEDLGIPGITADADPSGVVGERRKFSPESEARIDALQRDIRLVFQTMAAHGKME